MELKDWPWTSLVLRDKSQRPGWYSEGPVPRGRDWVKYAHEPQTDVELVALRQSVERGTPYGNPRWQAQTIASLGLESTVRPRGRPRKAEN
jgi:putative transposase